MPENQSLRSPKSHFFTIPTAIAQSSTQAFGPDPVSTETFRLSSGFTAQASAQAFAICKGIVLVQPQIGSATKVNLILRPYTQPIQGVNIKYFVYRGLRKSDFFDSNSGNVLQSGSDFITKIRQDFNDFYQNDPVDTNPPFLAKYIGFNPAQPETLLLDNFFFKEAEYVESNGEFIEDEGFGAFELPLIHAGASLGFFAAGECAIDVVLNYGDYKPQGEASEYLFDLAYARSAGVSITVSGTDSYNDKLKKEQVFQFLDIAAYYGFHTANGTVTINNNGAGQHLTGQDIYTTVLPNFLTKNKLYVYVQGDRTRSYNFYGNYTPEGSTESLRWGIDPEALTGRVYGTEGWPVIIESPQAESVYLQFFTDNNVNTVLFGQAGNIVNAVKNNFSNADDLLLPPDENGALSNYTKVLEFSNPITNDTTGAVIATFNIILYQGVTYSYIAGETVDDNNDPVILYATPNFFDDVFDLIKAEPLIKGANVDDYTVVNSQRLKLINEYYDKRQQGVQAVQTLMVKDSIETGDEANLLQKRVTYITETIDILNNAVSLTGKTASDTKSSPGAGGSVNPGITYKLPEPYNYFVQLFTDGRKVVTGLHLKFGDDDIQPYKIILGLTHSENELIKSLISNLATQNAKLFLVDIFDAHKEIISPENIIYLKYRVGVVAENENGTTQLFLPNDEIIVYSLDRRYHFSKDYSEYIQETSTELGVAIEKILI